MAMRCRTPGMRRCTRSNQGHAAVSRPRPNELRRAHERRPRGEPARERERHPDHEQEEREDEVGRRPAVPGYVLERPVDVQVIPGVVDEDHRGDRRAAEGVERDEAGRRGLGAHRLRIVTPFAEASECPAAHPCIDDGAKMRRPVSKAMTNPGARGGSMRTTALAVLTLAVALAQEHPASGPSRRPARRGQARGAGRRGPERRPSRRRTRGRRCS